MYFNAIILNF